jgi:hypothetical protein
MISLFSHHLIDIKRTMRMVEMVMRGLCRRASSCVGNVAKLYLRLDLAVSPTTFTFEVQILILPFIVGKILPILHFRLALLEYDMNKKLFDNDKREMVLRGLCSIRTTCGEYRQSWSKPSVTLNVIV